MVGRENTLASCGLAPQRRSGARLHPQAQPRAAHNRKRRLTAKARGVAEKKKPTNGAAPGCTAGTHKHPKFTSVNTPNHKTPLTPPPHPQSACHEKRRAHKQQKEVHMAIRTASQPKEPQPRQDARRRHDPTNRAIQHNGREMGSRRRATGRSMALTVHRRPSPPQPREHNPTPTHHGGQSARSIRDRHSPWRREGRRSRRCPQRWASDGQRQPQQRLPACLRWSSGRRSSNFTLARRVRSHGSRH